MSGPFGSSTFNHGVSSGFYNGVVDRSLRLEKADSSYLNFTHGTATDISKWTVNFWWKQSNYTATYSSDYVTLWGVEGPGTTSFSFIEGDIHFYLNYNSGGSQIVLRSNRKFKDPSAWYNFHVKFDRAQGTAANRLKIFVNGIDLDDEGGYSTDQRSTIASDSSSGWNVSGTSAAIGRRSGGQDSRYSSGTIAYFHNVDGQYLDATDFIEIKEGICIPKLYSGSYGNNGWKLEFKQTGTGTASSSTIGADTSGNDNHWTSNNLAASDILLDCPENNFSVLNSLKVNSQTQTFAQGNLDFSSTQTSTNPAVTGTFARSSGKWYWEVYIRAKGNDANSVGIASNPNDLENDTSALYLKATAYSYQPNGNKRNNGDSSYGNTWDTGDIIGVALDLDAGAVYFYKNGSIQNSGTAAFTSLSGEFTPYSLVYSNGAQVYNFGQDSSFNGNKTSGSANASDGNGQGDFYYAVPSGYSAQNSTNLPEPTLGPNSAEQSDDHFVAKLYEGTGSSQNITGLNFQPDLVFVKRRDGIQEPSITDSVRGVNAQLRPAVTNVESAQTDALTSFNSDGFTLGADGTNRSYNYYTDSHVAWCFKAGGATTVSNSDGSIDSNVSVNTDAGFSIVSFTADGETSGTVGHGLGVQPQLIIGKTRNHSVSWYVQTPLLATNLSLILDTTSAAYDPGYNHWNDTHPTTSVFSVGGYMADHADLTSPSTKIVYCFANVEGHCKVGLYKGNGGSQFVHTGFSPAFVLEKRTNVSAWNLYDNKRDPFSPQNTKALQPHVADAEATYTGMQFLSNGFAPLGTLNDAGTTLLFIAIAEAPFKYSNAY